MTSHDYSAGEALELLMGKLLEANKDLAEEIQLAIDEGAKGGREESTHCFDKEGGCQEDRRLRAEEALRLALFGIRALFVEEPSISVALREEFEKVGDGEVSNHLLFDGRTPFRSFFRENGDEDLVELITVEKEEVDEQKWNFDRLERLVSFPRGR